MRCSSLKKNKKKQNLGHLIVSRKSYNHAENNSGLGKLGYSQRWLELRLRLNMGRNKFEDFKVIKKKLNFPKLEKNPCPKADREWRMKKPAPHQIAFLKSLLVFVYELYPNKAILKSEGSHAVNEQGAQSRKQVGARLVALETAALNSAEP